MNWFGSNCLLSYKIIVYSPVLSPRMKTICTLSMSVLYLNLRIKTSDKKRCFDLSEIIFKL